MAAIATLCYIIKDGRILLIEKKRGLGIGFWNGPGGHVNQNESIDAAAAREVEEETGLMPKNLEKTGILHFYFGHEGEADMTVHVFVSKECSGKEKETDEARPNWFPLDMLPYDKMWPDDEIWMPMMLAGKKFNGHFYFEKGSNKLVKHRIADVRGFGF
jgi:8-oxo-dGTP pyrophosphatase MutT (NUDIX family)